MHFAARSRHFDVMRNSIQTTLALWSFYTIFLTLMLFVSLFFV